MENWDDASATIESEQEVGTSKVKIEIDDAMPNTLFTVWVRLKGKDQEGNFIGASLSNLGGGSPITGGGATPLAPSTALDTLVYDWVDTGSATQPNGFMTNQLGNGLVIIDLDFPLEGGAYPFNNMSAETLALAQTKNPVAMAQPAAIIDPRQAGITGTPFLIRVVSHCQDGVGHGLSPSNREAWFQFP